MRCFCFFYIYGFHLSVCLAVSIYVFMTLSLCSSTGTRAAFGVFKLHHYFGTLAVDTQKLSQSEGLQTLLPRGKPARECTSSAACLH